MRVFKGELYFLHIFSSNNNKELELQISALTANFLPFYWLFKFLYCDVTRNGRCANK